MRGKVAQRIESEALLLAAVAAALLLLALSLKITDGPFMAAGIVVAASAIVWACMKPKRLVYLLIGYCCVYPFLISDLGFPRLLSYGGDLINLLALFFSLRSGKLRNVRWGFPLVSLIGFSLVALFSAILHGISPLLFAWEVRNVLRFFAFLVACVGLLDIDDIGRIMRLLFIVFVINIFLCSYESLVLHYGQDNTNGLFGSGSGGNASTNVLLLEVTCLALFGYGRKVVCLPTLLFIIAGSCWVSVIAELKFYFVQLALLVALYLLVSKPSFKSVCMVVVLFFALWAFIQLFYVLMPGWDGFFDFEKMIDSSSQGGYGSNDGLNRLTAISTLQLMFLGDGSSSLFGLGFGAGTYSQFFASPLYMNWGEILHWTWFTDAQIFLETGYVGLVFYGLFFVFLGIHALRMRKGKSVSEAVLIESGAMISLFCVLLLVYNCVLTVDPGGYLIFFFLSAPLIVERVRNSESRESEASRWG